MEPPAQRRRLHQFCANRHHSIEAQLNKLKPGTLYHYVISAHDKKSGRWYKTRGTFKTLRRAVKVRFKKLWITDDSDNSGDGELRFGFYINGKPAAKYPFGQRSTSASALTIRRRSTERWPCCLPRIHFDAESDRLRQRRQFGAWMPPVRVSRQPTRTWAPVRASMVNGPAPAKQSMWIITIRSTRSVQSSSSLSQRKRPRFGPGVRGARRIHAFLRALNAVD